MQETQNTVSKSELLNELGKEYSYHAQDGATYRSQTTEIAIEVASKLHRTDLFFDREKTFQFVTKEFVNLDEDRRKDVSKMLTVITRDLHRKKTLPEDVKMQLEERRKKRKPLSVIR